MRAFWFFMLTMDLMIPLIMFTFGKVFEKKPPKSINLLYGYRTAMSMKNADTWAYSHRYFGKRWRRISCFLFPCSVLPLLFAWDAGVETIGIIGGTICLLQLIPLTVPLFLTEKELRRVFDENGNRRESTDLLE